METPQERHPADGRVARSFGETTDYVKEAYAEGYQEGKKAASLSWGGKFWVAVIICLVGVPVLLAWMALVEYLWGLL